MSKKNFAFVSDKDWDKYKNIITSFLDQDAGRQRMIWAKHVNQLLSHAEDSVPQFYKIEIEALCYYNAFRNWPINDVTTSGGLDQENLSIMVSKKYIEELGYLNENGYWDFNWVEDRFIINGLVYKPSGDTQVAQAKDEALVFLVILKRDKEVNMEYVELDNE